MISEEECNEAPNSVKPHMKFKCEVCIVKKTKVDAIHHSLKVTDLSSISEQRM